MTKKMVLGSFTVCSRNACKILFFAFVLVCTLVTPVRAGEDPVWDAAESFLELLDGGSFTQAWWEGSDLLHRTDPLDVWVEKQRMVRELMGKPKERTVKTVSQRASMTGLPDGDYRVLVVSSRFERKERGYEVLLLTKNPYADWKVVSYNLH